ncbi:hypothetical protein AV530_011798 [Patagioenas fasciata monilis]|uniref:Uncharacterized protein n=1 Tax=Patagioenas fasciata monilis TaxID=372326 RepID=A0A1V4KLP0_PATFA|nr:hypothetical protein AV530_011798 [Patagioenas fasciata monilis]
MYPATVSITGCSSLRGSEGRTWAVRTHSEEPLGASLCAQSSKTTRLLVILSINDHTRQPIVSRTVMVSSAGTCQQKVLVGTVVEHQVSDRQLLEGTSNSCNAMKKHSDGSHILDLSFPKTAATNHHIQQCFSLRYLSTAKVRKEKPKHEMCIAVKSPQLPWKRNVRHSTIPCIQNATDA